MAGRVRVLVRWVSVGVFVCAAMVAGAAPLPPPPPGVQISSAYGMEFSTIGSTGNAPYTGLLGSEFPHYPRASVSYEYRIGRTEVPTFLWMEFVNTFLYRTPAGNTFAVPGTWGATLDPSNPRHYILDPRIVNAAQIPVTDFTWREAAMFCNWLHNDKSSDLVAITRGAYDTSTFGSGRPGGGGGFTDQLVHSPGAKFWIPTLDEWQKAGYFDPNRYGPAQPGYWLYPHRSDEAPISGPPGEGQTNANFELEGGAQRLIPLASYGDIQSPWGLFDVSGAAAEWIETAHPVHDFFTGLPTDRFYGGSQLGLYPPDPLDNIQQPSSSWPDVHSAGLRIAAAIPGPTPGILFICLGPLAFSPRRRHR